MTYQEIYNLINKQGYFDAHKRVLVAVSTGVDSMNLLLFLQSYKKQLGITIGIAHVNHQQRLQSDQEEAFLKNWAKEHDVAFHVSHFEGEFSEKVARDFRYAFFKEVMQEEDYSALVTAHHANDQAETILMRLLRGSRLRYLTGISAVQPFGPGQLIRPFLTIKKSDLPQPFHFEDASNQSRDYLRNRIRQDYLPELSKENPKLADHLISLADEVAVYRQAFQDLTIGLDGQTITTFKQQSPAVQQVLLEDYLATFPDLQVTKAQFRTVLNLIHKGKSGTWLLKNGYYLHLSGEGFWIDKISPKSDGNWEPKVLEYLNITAIGRYQFEYGHEGDIPVYSRSPILLRSRKPGDRIDFGHFQKKLRRLFIDEKISQKDREQAIVAEQDAKVLFVLVGGKLYLRKAPRCVTIKAKLCIKTKEIGDL